VIGGSVIFSAASFHAKAAGFEEIQADNEFGGDNSDNVLDFSGLALVGTKRLRINGAQGNDEIRGLNTADVLEGGGHNDTIYGLGGEDVLDGGDGDDSVFGGGGNDVISGYDTVDADAVDQLFGEAGSDRLFATGQGSAVGGAGSDVIELKGALVLDGRIFGDDPLNATISGADTLTVGANTVFAVTSFSMEDASFEYLNALAGIFGDDSANALDFSAAGLEAGSPNPQFFGQAGNDTISATGANDTVRGGDGNDLLLGNGGNDTILGDFHDDTIRGGAGNDSLEGGLGNDLLFGDDGNDTLSDGDEVSMDGGADDDLLKCLGAVVKANAVKGGAGADTIQVDNLSTVTRFEGVAQGFEFVAGGSSFNGDGAGNFLDLSGLKPTAGAAVNVSGLGGNDTLIGPLGAVRIDGGSGDDSLRSHEASATLIGGDGNDVIDDGGGDSTVDGGIGSDTLSYSHLEVPPPPAPPPGGTVAAAGSPGIHLDLSLAGTQDTGHGLLSVSNVENATGSPLGDTIAGTGLANALSGLDGSDVLTGGLGDDTLLGGTGNDTLIGGAGADSLSGGTGIDVADYSASAAAVAVNLATGLGSGGDSAGDSLLGVENVAGSSLDDALTGNGGGNGLFGNSGNDTLTGNGGHDTLLGGAGADVLRGGSGDDRLVGGSGADTLGGGGGNDTLAGGIGLDLLRGDAGEDVFDFNSPGETGVGAAARDHIVDFAQGEDRIDVSDIDAVFGGSDDAFVLIFDAPFSHTAGELRNFAAGGLTLIEGDVDGDGAADFQIALTDNVSLVALDYVL
jgi:Ca2+-binding RTX toxin-like protein